MQTNDKQQPVQEWGAICLSSGRDGFRKTITQKGFKGFI
jgi:hypothetical protein